MIFILVIIINVISIINIVVIACNLANTSSSITIKKKTEDFSICIKESGQATNCEKSKYTLKSRAEKKRQNRNVRVANMISENVANF
jgi:hypothetical protein